MTAGAHGVTRSPRYRHAKSLVETEVNFAQPHARADAITIAVTGKPHRIQQTQIEDRAARVIHDEVFVAVPPAADGRSRARANDLLKRVRRPFRGLTQFNPA